MNKEDSLRLLGEKIREIRTAKGISQERLAYSINKDQQSIQRLEKGKTNPTYFFLLQIAKALDMEVADLLK